MGAADRLFAHVSLALYIAFGEWRKRIEDPDPRINTYIKKGLTWRDANLNKPGLDYKEDGDFSWCGAFVGFCYAKLKKTIRYNTFASCYRLNHDWQDHRVVHTELVRGDIVTVGKTRRKDRKYGSHICLVEQVNMSPGQTFRYRGADYEVAGTLRTIEGNAIGLGPDGTEYEGVTRNVRPIAHPKHALPSSCRRVLRAYRVQAEDFDE